jgi:hypothetical protein
VPEASPDTALRVFAQERKYTSATIERWLALEPDDGRALLELARELRLGENQLRDLWEWTEEIALRDGVSLAQVLALAPVAAARRNRTVGRNDKLKLVKGVLRRLRFPQLASTEDRLAALVRQLDLPRNVRVTFPEFLEGDEVRIEIVANSLTSLEVAAERLQAAAQKPECQAIFQLLAEAP